VGATRTAMRPGDVLLVAYERGNKGSVWCLRVATGAPQGRSNPVLPRATLAWSTASTAVERTLPMLVHPAPTLAGVRVFRPFAKVGTTPVDGASYGLSMAMAMASVRLGLSVPMDVAASAEVLDDGTLAPVHGLEAKVDALARDVGDVGRFVVCESQVDLVKGRHDHIEVIGCAHLAEVWPVLWPELVKRTVAQVRDVPAAARRLLGQVLGGHYTTRTWLPVARSATALAGRVLDDDVVTAGLLGYAASFAFRHAGAHSDARDWLEKVDRAAIERAVSPLWRRAIGAQLIQHVTDTAESEAEQRAMADAVGTGLMARRVFELEVGDRKQLGALGRLRHAIGDFSHAIAASELATASWLKSGDGHAKQASFPLSQWLLSAGAALDREAWSRAGRVIDAATSGGDFDEVGSPFVALARGRSALQLGDLDAAGRWLVAARDGTGPVHVRCSALRWLARLDGPDGEGARAELGALADGLEPTNACHTLRQRPASTKQLFAALHLLDAAVGSAPTTLDREPIDAALDRVCANDTATFAVRWRERGRSASEIAEAFPY